MEEKDNKDNFKDALRKKLTDVPIHSEEEDREIWESLASEMQLKHGKKKGVVIRMNWYAYAASIALLFAASGLLYFKLSEKPSNSIAQKPLSVKDSISVENADKEDIAKTKSNEAPTDDKNVRLAESNKVIEIKSTGIEEQELPDGSLITLNQGTLVKYSPGFSLKRTLSLQGEAYFQVQSDNVHPFSVRFGEHLLVVVGTKFNVRALNDSETEISVTEGIVKVYPSGEGEGLLVKRNEQLRIKNDTTEVIQVNATNYIAWKSGNLIFENTPMQQVALLLSRQYSVQVQIDPSILGCTFTGNLNKVSLENALKIVEMTTSFKIKVNSNNVYYISGAGCE